MSTYAIDRLIAEAQAEVHRNPCAENEHDWAQDGGRRCPELVAELAAFDVNCSQAVYRCRTCGAWDYGAKGGPGWNDCQTGCRHRGLLAELREEALQAPEESPHE